MLLLGQGAQAREGPCWIQTQVDELLWTEQPEWTGGNREENNAPPTAMETEPGGVPFPRDWNPRSLIELVALKKLRQEAVVGGAGRGWRGIWSLSQSQPGLALTRALCGPSHPQVTTLLQ